MHEGHVVVLPPRLFAPVSYFKAIARARRAIIDTGMRFDKRRKEVHRYEIVDARGRLSLTVPICKPHFGPDGGQWQDVLVSTHDQWWMRHRTALESAYGRTPYFEFLIDKFDSVFRSPAECERWPSVTDLIEKSNRVIADFLCISDKIEHATSVCRDEFEDLRGVRDTFGAGQPYWQVRADLHGFQDGLSVLDLIFNMGPEAAMSVRS